MLCGFVASRPTGDIAVPKLAGISVDQAEALLRARGLKVGHVEYDVDAPRPHGIVISQDPPVDWKAGIGAKVDLVVAGPELVRVPGLLRAPKDVARDTLEEAGLRRGRVLEIYDDYVPAGSVISQDPRGGLRVPKDTKVGLVVSLGPDSARVPGLIGLFEDDARDRVFRLGLDVDIDFEHDPRVPGIVVAQWPPVGTDIPIGDEVKLTVSRGPKMERVPNVVGMTADEASLALHAAGFMPRQVPPSAPPPQDAPPGAVYEQRPRARTTLPEGAVVTYSLRLFP
jgi:serine/threonine-protein kinase